MFWLKFIVKVLALPPLGPLLIAIAGLAAAGRHPRAGRRLAIAGVALLWLLATPAVADFLVRCLDRTPALTKERVDGAQAIVVLGGGTRPFAAEYNGPTLGPITLERVRYAATLARATKLPILVSGGAVRGAPPEAVMMRNVLVHEFGVPVRWMEARSRDTHENAVESAAMLRAAGVSKVILVGHSFDFPRSRKEFAAAGMDVIAAPIRIPPAVPTEFGDYLPGPRGLLVSYYACYEILANVLFDVTHAISGTSADTRSISRSSFPPPRGS